MSSPLIHLRHPSLPGLSFDHAKSLDLSNCLGYISLVWLTLMASPKGGTKRWATGTHRQGIYCMGGVHMLHVDEVECITIVVFIMHPS